MPDRFHVVRSDIADDLAALMDRSRHLDRCAHFAGFQQRRIAPRLVRDRLRLQRRPKWLRGSQHALGDALDDLAAAKPSNGVASEDCATMTIEPRRATRHEIVMTDHTVKAFDSELGSLQGVIAEMGTHSRRMLSDAMSALTSLNVDLATSVISADAHINALQRSVAHQAIHTIARRQPVAVDLREIIGAVRVAYDLERAGDLAKSIARRTEKVALADTLRWMASLKPLSARAALQLKNALAAYEQKDVALARTVSARDDKLDALEDFANRDLLTFMMESSANIPVCVELLFCVKGLDRIGDHATNIAETVNYMIAGEEPVSG